MHLFSGSMGEWSDEGDAESGVAKWLDFGGCGEGQVVGSRREQARAGPEHNGVGVAAASGVCGGWDSGEGGGRGVDGTGVQDYGGSGPPPPESSSFWHLSASQCPSRPNALRAFECLSHCRVIHVSGTSSMTFEKAKRSRFISTRKWAAEFDTAAVDSS